MPDLVFGQLSQGGAVSGRRMTIHDIAVIAGVSAGTVSRVINERDGVGDATRQRIAELVALHGFKANATAQQLSTGRAGAIGVVFPFHASEFVMNPVYPALVGSVGDEAEGAGYDILLLSVPNADQVGRMTDAVRRGRVDGVVLPAAGPRDPSVREIAKLGFPAVVIGHRSRARGIPWVDSTHDVACYQLTKLMIAGGRRRITLMNGSPRVSACALRSKGFWSAIEESKDSIDVAEEHYVGFDLAAAKTNVSRLLSRPGHKPPTAIVGANDTVAAACLEVAREIGLDVPRQLAVSGFDDLPFSAYTSPALTTVRMPLREIGATAARMLFALIEGRPIPKRHVVFPNEIVLRDSTAVPPRQAAEGKRIAVPESAARTGRPR
jgi:LacI family transcriptional regulator